MEEILGSEKNVMEYLEILFLSQRGYEQRIEILEKKYGILLEKETESEMRKMCTFSDAIWEKGIEKGRDEGILSNSIKNIQNLVRNHVASSIEEAMDLLGVEASLRPAILKSIQMD